MFEAKLGHSVTVTDLPMLQIVLDSFEDDEWNGYGNVTGLLLELSEEEGDRDPDPDELADDTDESPSPIASESSTPSPVATPSPSKSARSTPHSLEPLWAYSKSQSYDINMYNKPFCGEHAHLNTMNFVLTGAAIVHRIFFRLYDLNIWDHPAVLEAKRVTADAFNGEDILFAYMHAWITGKGPWVLPSNVDKILKAVPGLNNRPTHFVQRSGMLQLYVSFLCHLVCLLAL